MNLYVNKQLKFPELIADFAEHVSACMCRILWGHCVRESSPEWRRRGEKLFNLWHRSHQDQIAFIVISSVGRKKRISIKQKTPNSKLHMLA